MGGRGRAAPKILFPFAAPNVGGGQVSAHYLIKGLRAAGHDVSVMLLRPGPLSAYLNGKGIAHEVLSDESAFRWLRTASHDRPIRAGSMVARSARPFHALLRRRRIDILHSNHPVDLFCWSLPARLAAVPHVWHFREKEYPRRPPFFRTWPVERVICLSEYNRTRLPASIRSRALRIDNPFEAPDPERSDTEVRRRTRAGLGVPEGGWLYGYFANLYGRKRPYAFIDAAAEIMRRRSNAFFIMSGDDRTITREEVRSAARSRGIGDRLTTLPFTSEVFDRMRACDVILAPAVDEPFGRVLVEAMMLGVPVVAANSGGHGEILKPGCGVLVPPDDTAALADAAVQLVDDAQWRAQLVERARAEARSRFSVEAHVSAIERVYADMLGDRRAAPGRNVGRKLLRGWL